jgi:hypothetical protein
MDVFEDLQGNHPASSIKVKRCPRSRTGILKAGLGDIPRRQRSARTSAAQCMYLPCDLFCRAALPRISQVEHRLRQSRRFSFTRAAMSGLPDLYCLVIDTEFAGGLWPRPAWPLPKVPASPNKALTWPVISGCGNGINLNRALGATIRSMVNDRASNSVRQERLLKKRRSLLSPSQFGYMLASCPDHRRIRGIGHIAILLNYQYLMCLEIG